MVVVIPEYDAGFTFLNAFYEDSAEAAAHPQLYDVGVRTDAALKLTNQIVETVLPALEAQAVKESCHNLAGTFAVSENVNSSLKLVSEHGQPGLLVKEWTSNSTDMIKAGLLGSTASQPAQLLVSILSRGFAGAAVGVQVTLQASVNPQALTYNAAGRGPLTGTYKGHFDWFSGFEGSRYGGGELRTFTFDIDEDGAATAVTNGAARLRMPRV